MEIAIEALAEVAYDANLSKESMMKIAYDAINELEMIGDMYSYGYQD
tara:strand:+ start:382 stop:522 length:141 start_codon:yes stop_codon:yes gene_type:complete